MAQTELLPTRLCFGAPHGVSWRPFLNCLLPARGVPSADGSTVPGTGPVGK